MSDRVEVARSDALVEGATLAVEAFGASVVLVRSGGQVYALSDVCPHRGAPMHAGEVEDGCIICPLHGWAFSLETGQMEGGPGLSIYSVTEEDGVIRLGRPSE